MRILWLLVLAFALPLPVRAETPAFQLQKPIACTLGQDCFIQQYPDHDPGPDAKDYRCGIATYDGHDGTDFRIPDKVAQAGGVAVLAAAPGVVKAIRDGQPDFDVGAFDKARVKGIECGNGVLVEHADGWQTQYCHMRQGSVRVKAGDRVAAGTPLGMVGQSGGAAFPHLHLTVRRNGKWLDPFADGGPCGQGQSLWKADDRAELAYHDNDILNAGFAGSPVTVDDIERGGIAAPTRASPALVVYVRALHLHQGDIQRILIKGPDGQTLVDSASPALDHDKAQAMVFSGKKRPGALWPAGSYSAVYTVTRAGKVILSKTLSQSFAP
ncbi:M23 family metallopeptidase [Asticcacaulis solisilvae]|uniref:M23 family metallopeptidase n=1 Tax=Asticcacaulis solisilvae TaxID=1217274 RepID=UPI003FD8B41C